MIKSNLIYVVWGKDWRWTNKIFLTLLLRDRKCVIYSKKCLFQRFSREYFFNIFSKYICLIYLQRSQIQILSQKPLIILVIWIICIWIQIKYSLDFIVIIILGILYLNMFWVKTLVQTPTSSDKWLSIIVSGYRDTETIFFSNK